MINNGLTLFKETLIKAERDRSHRGRSGSGLWPEGRVP